MKTIKNDLFLDGELFCFFEFDGKTNWFFNEDLTKKISRKKFKDFEVKCHDCGKLVKIKSVTDKIQNKTYLCKKCRVLGKRNPMFGKHVSDDVKKVLSIKNSGENGYWYGKHLTDETKEKIRQKQIGKYVGEKNPMYGVDMFKLIEDRYGIEKVKEIKNKISKSVSGEKNPFYGKRHTEEVKKHLKEINSSKEVITRNKSDDFRKKVSDGLKNSDKFKKVKEYRKTKEYSDIQSKRIKNSEAFKKSHTSDEYRKKRRLITCNQIINLRDISGNKKAFMPMFNKKACEYFNKLMEEKNINIQHAMNGGEYAIPELGYFVDGYDKENNVVYEFDENYHYLPNGELRECDKKRQKEIEDFLKCKFIRIKENEIY